MRIVARHPRPGWFDSRVKFARLLLADHPSPPEKSEALEWLRQAMNDGCPQAEATLDVLGEPVLAPDASRIQGLEDQCGMAPGTPACWRVGRIYELGGGVPKDLEKALKYYARCGTFLGIDDPIQTLIVCHAAEGIVRILASGFAPPKGWSAASLLPKSPDLVTNAATRLQVAELLWNGNAAVPPNRTAAIKWFTASATSGSAEAMCRLGDFWAEGLNGKPDGAEAMLWYRRAATGGLVPAQLKLAQAYSRGSGGQTNLLEAYIWFELAAQQGSAEARRLAGELETTLTSSQIENAHKRVQELLLNVPAKQGRPNGDRG
jgi:TPR repeat protein